MKTIRIIIKGKVQGVFFRASAREVAIQQQLKGWVRNTKEGYVEACVTGTEEQLMEFVNWCRQGPSRARVDEVNTLEQPFEFFHAFEIRR